MGFNNRVLGDSNGLRYTRQPRCIIRANEAADIFVKDLATGAIERISNAAGGTQGNGNSWGQAFSPDATKVALESSAFNLVPGDTNGQFDIFVETMATGAICFGSTIPGRTLTGGRRVR
jgi:Tol biopolymer transport system component